LGNKAAKGNHFHEQVKLGECFLSYSWETSDIPTLKKNWRIKYAQNTFDWTFVCVEVGYLSKV